MFIVYTVYILTTTPIGVFAKSCKKTPYKNRFRLFVPDPVRFFYPEKKIENKNLRHEN